MKSLADDIVVTCDGIVNTPENVITNHRDRIN